MLGSQKVTVFLSPLSYLSSQTTKKKQTNKDGSDWNQKGRRQQKSRAHSLHSFPVLSKIDIMTFTKSVLQSIKLQECQSNSQSSLEAGAEKGAGAEYESEAV